MRTGGRLSSCLRCLSSWLAISSASGPAHVVRSGQHSLRLQIMSAKTKKKKKHPLLYYLDNDVTFHDN